ncbi:MAG: SUMF1/EgtB/PvdO family nonheme iron enzyme [Deltaproteobacteria bacterium]|nr:SUMF1/EgtB/PvdO family nonheme iron enzyme [Deltaproteobacteria bacterium]
MKRTLLLAGLLLSACYSHARRDAPAQPPSTAAGEMVTIPGGNFTMGDRNGEPDEYPERSLSMRSYRIDVTEVSNAAFRLCVLARACDPSGFLDHPVLGQDDHPAVGVPFADASRFCTWVGRRLPTEAEWEYAAKGTDFRKWPWKGAFDPKKVNSSAAGDDHPLTAPVGAYPEGASPFGALNMSGNAAEWVTDFFDPTYYRTATNTTHPSGPTSGRERVIRGGSYLDGSHLVRVSARRAKLETEVDNAIGFRCAAD